MSNPSLIARLGLDPKDFLAGLNASEAGLQKLQEDAKLTAAQIALLEQKMAAGKTDEMVKQHTALQASLRQTQAEAKATARQLAAMEAIKPPAPVAPPMPAASRPQAVITRGYAVPAGQDDDGGHGGSNTARNAELMHSGRAMVDMMSAGMSPLQAFMSEAPRLFQAFAGSLGALLVPIGALAAGGAFVKWLHDADTEAKALRAETAAVASNLGSIAGANAAQLDKSLAEAAAQVRKVREANDSKSNQLVNMLTGGGVHDSDVQAATGQQQRVQDRMQDAEERDQGYSKRSFDGDTSVDAERIRTEYAQKRDEILKKASVDDITSSTRALAIAREARDQALDTLARKQAFQQNEVALETQLVSIRRYGKDVDVENARARMEKAKADLDAGPKEGPEHDALQNKYWSAQDDHTDASRKTARERAEAGKRRGLLDDEAAGNDDEVTKAERDLAEAHHKRAATQANTPERAAATDAVEAARLELANAQRTTAERKEQLDLAQKVAGITGSQSEKERAQLEGEKHILEERLRKGSDTYEPNDKKREDIEKRQLPEIAGKITTLNRSDAEADLDTQGNQIKAATGRGPAAHIQELEAEIALLQKRRALITEPAQQAGRPLGHDEAKQVSGYDAQSADLVRQKKELEETSAQELADAQAKTKELELQLTGQRSAAQVEGIRAGYEERIAAAIRDGKTDLAAQLGIEKDLALEAAKLAEFRKTPAQRQKENMDHQKDQQDLKAMHGQERRQLDNKRQLYEDEHRAELPLDPKARKAIIEKAVPDTIQKDVPTTAAEAPENATDASFNRRFHPQQPAAAPTVPKLPVSSDLPAFGDLMSPPAIPPREITVPNRIDAIKAGAENAGKGDGGTFNDKGIISAVNAVEKAVSNISFRNRK